MSEPYVTIELVDLPTQAQTLVGRVESRSALLEHALPITVKWAQGISVADAFQEVSNGKLTCPP